MSKNRIVFQNWIADLGFDPLNRNRLGNNEKNQAVDDQWLQKTVDSNDSVNGHKSDNDIEELKKTVRKALKKLTDNEREFVTLFYYQGKTYREISQQSGIAIYRLEALHQRALKRLKRDLRSFVEKRYEIVIEVERECPLCQSPHREEIDKLIRDRDTQETWRTVIKQLRENYNIEVKTPQLLIGHEKYH